MEPNKSDHLCTVRFDEQMETWFVHTGAARIPLSRVLLQELVSLYNDIHRGSALTLIDRRALEELDLERRELRAAPGLLERLAAEPPRGASAGPGLRERWARAARIILSLGRPRGRAARRC